MNGNGLSELITDIRKHLLFDGYGVTEQEYAEEEKRIKNRIKSKMDVLKNENSDLYLSMKQLNFAKNLARYRMMRSQNPNLKEICCSLALREIEVNNLEDYKICQDYKYFDILKETNFEDFEAVYREEKKRIKERFG